jgi:putative ABC transport system permease protein
VTTWLDGALIADVYVSAPAATAGRLVSALDAGLVRRIAATPGVAGISTYRNVDIPLDDGDLRVIAVDLFPPHRDAFRFLEGDARRVWAAFDTSAIVIVSEPLAWRRGLRVGALLAIPTDRGERSARVAGIFQDYASEHGTVFIGRRTWDTWFDDPTISSVAVFAQRDADVDGLVTRLRALDAGSAEVLFRSNRALRAASLEVFDRTFAITIVLRALALVVAFVGVLGALMALQLERARELGVLRAIGLTPGQVQALVVSQTGLMGLASGLLAVPLGLGLAWLMIAVVNRRSFGWTIPIDRDAGIVAQSILLAVLAALLAGAWPAWKLARGVVAAGLREE